MEKLNYYLVTQYSFYDRSWVEDTHFISNKKEWKDTNFLKYKIERIKLINDKK